MLAPGFLQEREVGAKGKQVPAPTEGESDTQTDVDTGRGGGCPHWREGLAGFSDTVSPAAAQRSETEL